jgi:hypothetical protein
MRYRYSPGSLKAVASELTEERLDLVGVQETGWDKAGTEGAEE